MNPSDYRKEYLLRLGEKVRNIRIERGMSQDDLAQACGYRSRSSINKIEKGIYDLPLPKLRILADALGVSPAVFIESAPQPTDEDIALAQQIARLDSYRRALIESILNTEPDK